MLSPLANHRKGILNAATFGLDGGWRWPRDKLVELTNPPTLRAIFTPNLKKLTPRAWKQK